MTIKLTDDYELAAAWGLDHDYEVVCIKTRDVVATLTRYTVGYEVLSLTAGQERTIGAAFDVALKAIALLSDPNAEKPTFEPEPFVPPPVQRDAAAIFGVETA